jgi:hypothetical protein
MEALQRFEFFLESPRVDIFEDYRTDRRHMIPFPSFNLVDPQTSHSPDLVHPLSIICTYGCINTTANKGLTMEPAKKAVFFDLDNTLFDHCNSLRSAISVVQKKFPRLSRIKLEELIDTYKTVLRQAYDWRA